MFWSPRRLEDIFQTCLEDVLEDEKADLLLGAHIQ